MTGRNRRSSRAWICREASIASSREISSSEGAYSCVAAIQLQGFEFKEITTFLDPFDIKGAALIIYRYSDPHRSDEAWAYLSVLAASAASRPGKSDSLLGTDCTLDDFYSLAGRGLDWDFKCVGWNDASVVANGKHTYTQFFGPTSMTPDNLWSCGARPSWYARRKIHAILIDRR